MFSRPVNVKVDLDVMDDTVAVYNKAIDDLEAALKNLDHEMKELKFSQWKSDASDAFFDQYDNQWKNDMQKHIIYLTHLRDCLKNAQERFHICYDATF